MPKQKKNKIWEELPVEPQGSPSEEEIFLAVGRALSRWEELETNLFLLYGELHGLHGGPAAMFGQVAFGNSRSSGERSSMLLVISELLLGKNHQLHRDIKAAIGTMRELSHRRDDIAHGMASEISHGGEGQFLCRGWYLLPAGYYTRRRNISSEPRHYSSLEEVRAAFSEEYKYVFTAKQIDIYTGYFEEYSRIIWTLIERAQNFVRTRREQCSPGTHSKNLPS